MDNKRIIELKKRIEDYIQAGGDIYAPKRQLPYYNYLTDTVKYIRKNTGMDVAVEDVYRLCGINFNREFNHYKEFLTKLKPFVKNGYADEIRTQTGRSSSNVYTMLKSFADKYNTTPFDFLVLMTGFRFSNCYIKTDYVETLKSELLEAYPNRDIGGIRWEHPELYEKLRIVHKSTPGSRSINDIVVSLGFANRNMQLSSTSRVDEINVVNELEKLYQTRQIVNLREINPELYYKVLHCCRKANKTTVEWCKKHNFTYVAGQSHLRLSKTKMDKANADNRAQMLINLKIKALNTINFDKSDPVESFEANLKATQIVINALNKQQIKNNLIETQLI